MSAPVMETSPRSKVYSFRLPTSQVAELNRIKADTGATVGEQIRRAIKLWIAKQRRAK